MKTLSISMTIIVLLAGCRTSTEDHAHNPDGSHVASTGTELAPLAYTLYTEKTELFVEFKPLVVGHESRFAAHFTSLGDTFKAIGEGSVKLSLNGSTGNQSIIANGPEVPGIFRLRLIPDKKGIYNLVFDLSMPTYSDQITIENITVYSDEKAAADAQVKEGGGSEEITYLKEQAWKVDFANYPVNYTTYSDVVKTSGTVLMAPGSDQTVAARTSGIVTFTNNRLMTGSAVKAGERMFNISSKGFTNENAALLLQEAKITLDKAQADYDRLQKMLTDQLTTRSEFLRAKTELERAETVYSSLSNNYGQSGQGITAIQGGYIKSLHVLPGQYVTAGDPLAIISKNERLLVKAELSQRSYSKIEGIATANFKFNNQTVYTLHDLHGKFLSIGKFAENNMFIPIWFEIDNRPDIIPGSYVEVFLHTNTVKNALVIPLSALLEEQGNYYCYVQTSGEGFEKRELALGGNDGKQVQVLAGILPGERVVTKGAYNIKLSTATGTIPAHGHEH